MAETKLHGDVHFCNTSGLHFPLPWTYGYLIVKNKSRKYRHASSRKKKQHEVPICIKLLSLIFCRICSFYGTVHGIIYKGYVLCR
ncbi:hypothetical protein CFC21_092083 [Triticum aestivum]|uniref:Uncharacterized protein n=2 Tax=Triticum aestivum TaxID=4565 RepID=A0A3B6QF62_WHEAT|nr:hypothetical protein CFC21_092083 [Triticum aestivum]